MRSWWCWGAGLESPIYFAAPDLLPSRSPTNPNFDSTPKAFANFSPGFERSREPWGNNRLHAAFVATLKELRPSRPVI